MKPEAWLDFELRCLESRFDVDIESLRARVRARPDDLRSRVRLATAMLYGRGAGVLAAAPHLEFIIRELPFLTLANAWELGRASNPLYRRFATAWLRGVASYRDNAAALHHAFLFFSAHEPRRAAGILARATALDATIPALYANGARFAVRFPTLVAGGRREARALGQRAHGLAEARLTGLLGHISFAYWFAGDRREALELSRRALEPGSFNVPEGVHLAETVVGLSSLEDDVACAVLSLRRSSVPSYGPFGPTLSLARKLLKRNQLKPVQEFLESLIRTWEWDRDAYASSLCSIQTGAPPRLRALDQPLIDRRQRR